MSTLSLSIEHPLEPAGSHEERRRRVRENRRHPLIAQRREKTTKEEEIVSFCQLKYNVSFPQFAKIKVNGAEADPLYVWLKDQKGGTLGKAIKWNFTKFLIDREGNVVERYAPVTKPEEIEKDLLPLLAK